jgi:hypothetical protein
VAVIIKADINLFGENDKQHRNAGNSMVWNDWANITSTQHYK